jgi:hypothetical protein
MTLLIPAGKTEKAVYAPVGHVGPVCIRLSRPAVPVVHGESCDLTIGKSIR